ncbi:uncharacterized protein DNG_05259 [Cephalotrichum gorgonifer]|uniref:Heterokaryon incompatibility domain-containing protein n=1 Tax=Cephalotrichum gorgonifer TaxID=2041049 RepID=A0AAE8MXK5_9PEZI|nr:uncharacterized protein DNG_05259 [Cephalotrichum gorgonifer]
MSLGSSKLCSICAGFDVRNLLLAAEAQSPGTFNDPSAPDTLEGLRPALYKFYKQHPNLLSLRSSADECDLCRAILQAYASKSHPHELSDELMGQGMSTQQIWIGTMSWDATLHGLPHVAVTQHSEKGSIRTLASFETCASRGYEPRDNNDLLAKSIYQNSGSAECLKLAGDLLSSCLNGHKSCSSHYPAASEFPTRIIDVQGPEPKLIDGAGRQGTFAALSYCWGGDTTFKLTKATEAQFRAGRPHDDFPATLRDAISVTRALGLQYLWIDALCIIQDSAEDWAREAARMRDVYRGAVVTIAAACAAATVEGIFRDRRAPSEPRCWLDWRNGENPLPRVFLRPGAEISDSRMNQSALSSRGWILQETLLAPRTLWFGAEQICFECPNGSVEESGRHIRVMEMYRSKEYLHILRRDALPIWRRRLVSLLKRLRLPLAVLVPYPSLTTIVGARDLETLRHRALMWHPLTIQGNFKPPATPVGMSHFDLWIKIIENYSCRALTNTTDTLPALSGLANEFHRATGDTYVAGLWKGDILRGLCWNRTPQRKRLPNGRIEYQSCVPERYLAPSWSWAGCHGRIVLFGPQSQFDPVTPFAKIVEIDIQLTYEDPFGAISAGSITLSGPLLRLGTVQSLNAAQSPTPYPNLMKDISPLIKDLVVQGYGEDADVQQLGLLMLLKWREASTKTQRVCFLLLLGVDGEDNWRRVTCLSLKTKEMTGIDRDRTEQSQAILREISRDMHRETVRIV